MLHLQPGSRVAVVNLRVFVAATGQRLMPITLVSGHGTV
jgi:hypothetical protein